ncbi:calponin-3-like [Amphiura filiformis]|uniref:calponin-3-like n=1 Tax=Amphiura filiformis TaxID=82378 RepID=UPI003B20EB54
MATRTQAHGLTADINRKIAANYDVEREIVARDWITQLTGEELQGPPGMDNFHLALKDGVILCKLVNVLQPGSVKKINTNKMVFKQRENISMFLTACSDIGVASHSSFQTVDLFEKQNMVQVLSTLFILSSAVSIK